MARINLLPWREELRKQQQKEFFLSIALATGLTAFTMFLVHMAIADKIEYQEQRNRYLTMQIAVLDKKIKEIRDLEKKKETLISKMEIIQSLQSSRPEIVHLFDSVARTVPEGVYITKLTQSGDNLSVDGFAQSNARVSAYMRNIESSPWLEKPQLQIIETKAKSKHEREGRFSLKIKQAHPKANENEGGKS
ncbi:MAG: pilus assembly protein PilN [Methylothermaceae bacteria B42]|nr:MAG: pilus assembly protein PilN [Methylothermaceae bacteria B42]HHJ38161.1 pilus assembly protein PilN [Methylothermaceae bacterium]